MPARSPTAPTQILYGEPEAIPVKSIEDRWGAEAARRHREARSEEDRRRHARSLTRKIRQLALAGDPVIFEIEKLLETRDG